MRVVIDKQRCSGHGRCYTLSPTVFTDDANGYGEVINVDGMSEAQRGEAQRAADACPEKAITIEQ